MLKRIKKNSFVSYGNFLVGEQEKLDPAARDYSYIEHLRKSAMMVPGALISSYIKSHESKRDYFTPSLRQVNHLVQIDEKPNVELMEPKWELYKVSISFEWRKFRNLIDFLLY